MICQICGVVNQGEGTGKVKVRRFDEGSCLKCDLWAFVIGRQYERLRADNQRRIYDEE